MRLRTAFEAAVLCNSKTENCGDLSSLSTQTGKAREGGRRAQVKGREIREGSSESIRMFSLKHPPPPFPVKPSHLSPLGLLNNPR